LTRLLYKKGIKIFDYPKFAEPFRDKLKETAAGIASANGIEIEYIRKGNVCKEEIISKIINKRGAHPGMVHILSVMEGCNTYQPWHDKTTGRCFLKYDQSKCLFVFPLSFRF